MLIFSSRSSQSPVDHKNGFVHHKNGFVDHKNGFVHHKNGFVDHNNILFEPIFII
jgi:hypothetical protein